MRSKGVVLLLLICCWVGFPMAGGGVCVWICFVVHYFVSFLGFDSS